VKKKETRAKKATMDWTKSAVYTKEKLPVGFSWRRTKLRELREKEAKKGEKKKRNTTKLNKKVIFFWRGGKKVRGVGGGGVGMGGGGGGGGLWCGGGGGGGGGWGWGERRGRKGQKKDPALFSTNEKGDPLQTSAASSEKKRAHEGDSQKKKSVKAGTPSRPSKEGPGKTKTTKSLEGT